MLTQPNVLVFLFNRDLMLENEKHFESILFQILVISISVFGPLFNIRVQQT